MGKWDEITKDVGLKTQKLLLYREKEWLKGRMVWKTCVPYFYFGAISGLIVSLYTA